MLILALLLFHVPCAYCTKLLFIISLPCALYNVSNIIVYYADTDTAYTVFIVGTHPACLFCK